MLSDFSAVRVREMVLSFSTRWELWGETSSSGTSSSPRALSREKFELISNGKNASPHLTFEES